MLALERRLRKVQPPFSDKYKSSMKTAVQRTASEKITEKFASFDKKSSDQYHIEVRRWRKISLDCVPSTLFHMVVLAVAKDVF